MPRRVPAVQGMSSRLAAVVVGVAPPVAPAEGRTWTLLEGGRGFGGGAPECPIAAAVLAPAGAVVGVA